MRTPTVAIALLVITTALAAQRPGGFPPIRVPAGNPITPEKVLLGKTLFFEEQMSATRTVACATCHIFAAGGSDPRSSAADSVHPGRDLQPGTADDIRGSKGVLASEANGSYRPAATFGLDVQVTSRRAPSVINALFAPMLFWDGRANDVFVDPADGRTVLLGADAALETQASAPPVSDVEMAHFGARWTDVASRIASATPLAIATNVPPALATFLANRTYPDLFQLVYGTRDVTPARILMAIATYERTLVADQSPFDDFNRGNQNALTAAQRRGLGLFTNHCAQCHGGPLMTDNQFHNTGVRPGIEDNGREAVTLNPADRARFRTPSTRNIDLRAPYFHNGGAKTLQEVVDFYDRGGDFNAQNKDPRIHPLGLNAGQRADLVDFMHALTDPRVAAESAPFDRPTLYTETVRVPAIVGAGTAGTGKSTPEVVAVEPPCLGNPNLTLGVRRALGGVPAVLAIDVDATATAVRIGGANIHLPLNGGLVLVPAGLLLGAGAGQGFASLSFAVPTAIGLRGATIGVQWVIADTGAGALFAATPAARLRAF